MKILPIFFDTSLKKLDSDEIKEREFCKNIGSILFNESFSESSFIISSEEKEICLFFRGTIPEFHIFNNYRQKFIEKNPNLKITFVSSLENHNLINHWFEFIPKELIKRKLVCFNNYTELYSYIESNPYTKLHVKSVEKNWSFSGYTASFIRSGIGSNYSGEILLSDYIDIYKDFEFRAFFISGKLKGVCSIDWEIMSKDLKDKAFNFLSFHIVPHFKLFENLKDVVVDFSLTTDNNWVIIELNDPCTSGIYEGLKYQSLFS